MRSLGRTLSVYRGDRVILEYYSGSKGLIFCGIVTGYLNNESEQRYANGYDVKYIEGAPKVAERESVRFAKLTTVQPNLLKGILDLNTGVFRVEDYPNDPKAINASDDALFLIDTLLDNHVKGNDVLRELNFRGYRLPKELKLFRGIRGSWIMTLQGKKFPIHHLINVALKGPSQN